MPVSMDVGADSHQLAGDALDWKPAAIHLRMNILDHDAPQQTRIQVRDPARSIGRPLPHLYIVPGQLAHQDTYRRLIVADLALARAGLVRWLMLVVLAAILVGTAWLLLIALAVWGLYSAGLSLGMSLTLPLVASALLGVPAYWHAMKALKWAELDASRRQLTLLFGTKEEAQEAKTAPPGSLNAGAPPAPSGSESQNTTTTDGIDQPTAPPPPEPDP